MDKYYIPRIDKKFLALIILVFVQILTPCSTNCQVKLSAAISSGVQLNMIKKPKESNNKFSISPIIGIELGLLLKSRIGFSLGYFHSQFNQRFKIAPIDKDIKLIYSVRHFPIALEFVVWNDSKNRYNLLSVKSEKYISVKIGTLNIIKQIGFGKDNHLTNKMDIDEYMYYFNQQNFNSHKMQLSALKKNNDFFKSPFIGVKFKLEDRNRCSISFEALYCYDSVPYDDIIIRSKSDDKILPTKFTSHIFQFRVNVALIYDH